MRSQSIRLFILVLTFTLTAALVLNAQEKIRDRREWIDKSTPTTDDPRRIPTSPAPKGPEITRVLKGGRVFDGTGAPAVEATLVIERNKIKAILPPESTDWPADAEVIDVSGMTVMPGMIDLHTHVSYWWMESSLQGYTSKAEAALRGVDACRYYIESGITSVRDLAGPGDAIFWLKEWSSLNRIPAPRIFPSGRLIIATGGHGSEGFEADSQFLGDKRVADGPDEWREAVREQFNLGADVIKTGSHFSREEIAAAVDEAHSLGLKVACDAETYYIQWAVEAGVDTIEHPLPRADETIRLMAEKGTQAVPTLVPYIYIFDGEGGYFGSASRRFTFSKEANLELLRKMKEAGVKMGIGTDLVLGWYRYLPQAYITELEQYVAVGYTIPEVLSIATKTSAEILDMDDKLGTLEPGKLADVLVVRGKPDGNLDDLKNVEMVLRDGYVVVKEGRVFIPRHVQLDPPEPKEK
ncbi:MAG TPA: amidohydrolase family protein [Acidobacteriota bacterium]|nr:amidohydrolase family protein [Acidobacteriota bacterium]